MTAASIAPPRAVEGVLARLDGPLARRVLRGRRLLDPESSALDGSTLPTGFPDWDRLLGGGLRRGTLNEIVGRRSSGRFTLTLSLLAAATAAGETAALVDLGDGFDPREAEAAGVDLDRLLWLRPHSSRQALAAAGIALDGGFPLVLLELGLPPVPGGRGNEATWVRLGRAAADHRTALIVSAPYRVSGTAAHLVLRLAAGRGTWLGKGASPRLLGEMGLRVELEKVRGRHPGERILLHATPSGATPPAPSRELQGAATRETPLAREACG